MSRPGVPAQLQLGQPAVRDPGEGGWERKGREEEKGEVGPRGCVGEVWGGAEWQGCETKKRSGTGA